MRLMLKIDGMTGDEQRHTVRQKSGGIDGRCVDYSKRCLPIVGHADKNCCENKAVADNREIEKERNTGSLRLRLLENESGL